MISLNNHQSLFFSASGAMAYRHGWPWDHPFRWLGYYDVNKFTVITKTLTEEPRKGNLKLWKWWRCIHFLGYGNVVNSVGLTNPGIMSWVRNQYEKLGKQKVVVSVMVEDEKQARRMANWLNNLDNIVGVQLNVSCPNVGHKEYDTCEVVRQFVHICIHPVILKLGYQDDYVNICKELEGVASAFELINAVPWAMVFPDKPSPLAKYGLVGGVSGPVIAPFAREALSKVRAAGVKAQIISGGGIDSKEEVQKRHDLGADGFALGVHFLTQIWKTNEILSWKPEGVKHGCIHQAGDL